MTQKFLLRRIQAFICVCVLMLNSLPSLLAQKSDETNPTPSPTPAPTPESETVKRLKEKKEEAELRKAIAEAEKAEREARFPDAKTTPLEGKTTVEGIVIEPQILSYKAMNNAAVKLIDEIRTAKPNPTIKSLAIFNEQQVSYLLKYGVALNQLALIETGYNKVLKPSPNPSPNPSPSKIPLNVQNRINKTASAAFVDPLSLGLASVGSILGSFVDLTALLRTNVEIKGQTFVVDEEDLVAAVLNAANDTEINGNSCTKGLCGLSAYYPAKFPPKIDPNKDYKILKKLQEVYTIRVRAEKLISDLADNEESINKTETQIDVLEGRIAELTKFIDQEVARRAEFQNLKADYLNRKIPIPFELDKQIIESTLRIKDLTEQKVKAEERLIKAAAALKTLEADREKLINNFSSNVNTSDLEEAVARLIGLNNQFDIYVKDLVEAKDNGINTLTEHILAENLFDTLTDTNSYWLQLKLVKAGGNNRVKTNFLIDIFTGGNRLSHSGGAIVEYILYKKDGQVAASGIVTNYTGYKKSSNINKMP